MKKTHIIILSILCILAIIGITAYKQKHSTSNTKQITDDQANKDTIADTNTDANSDTGTDTNNDITDKDTISDKVSVTIESISGTPGSIVTIPVKFDTITDKGIGCCNFSIEYDNKSIEVEEVIPGDIIGSNTYNLEYALADSKGEINFLFAGEDEEDTITKAGIFANIKFRINENAASGDYTLAFGADKSFGDINLETVESVFEDGNITIK